MRFYKSMMLERIGKEGRSGLVGEKELAVMDNLDGCEASASCWERQVNGKPVYWVVGKDGNGFYVNEADCR